MYNVDSVKYNVIVKSKRSRSIQLMIYYRYAVDLGTVEKYYVVVVRLSINHRMCMWCSPNFASTSFCKDLTTTRCQGFRLFYVLSLLLSLERERACRQNFFKSIHFSRSEDIDPVYVRFAKSKFQVEIEIFLFSRF